MTNPVIFLCIFLISAITGFPKDKKITLDDIENDLHKTPPRPMNPKTLPAAKSPTQYGFVPSKVAEDYIRIEPKPTYLKHPSDYNRNVAGFPGKQKYTTLPLPTQPQFSLQVQNYVAPPQQQQQQLYTVNPVAQTAHQYQQYEGVQYVTDNHVGQGQQQYYQPQPQYIYVQQYQSPSTAVQNVVDPKGAVQYALFIPTHTAAADQSQAYENVVYKEESAPQAYQTTKSPSYQSPQPTSYTPASSTTNGVSYQPRYIEQDETHYVQPTHQFAKTEYFPKREPQSLLDSYVPSYLQLQYYKQAQQNAIRDTVKVPQIFSGKQYVQQNIVPSNYNLDEAASFANYSYRPLVYSH